MLREEVLLSLAIQTDSGPEVTRPPLTLEAVRTPRVGRARISPKFYRCGHSRGQG
jgi:hypothetical protein